MCGNIWHKQINIVNVHGIVDASDAALLLWRRMNLRKARIALLKVTAAVIVLCAIAEIASRLSGITDFPVYAVDDEIGYIAKPNQSGSFLDKNSWAINSKSMPTAEAWNPARRPNVLLIGNSVVMGGNPYDQKDKLAPLISSATGSAYEVWPIAAGGWTNVNEMVYLRRNPDVVKAANFFAWEYMSGGLSDLSQWRGDYVFPTSRPVWSSWYVLRRYVAPHFVTMNMNELPPVGAVKANHFADFEAAVGQLSKSSGSPHPGLIFLYPTRKELIISRQSAEWLPERKMLLEICQKYGLRAIDIAQNGDWNESLYRDGVHPTVRGNAVLAKILSSAIAETFVATSRNAAN